MARWNRAVGGVRSYAKRLRAPKAVRQAPVSAAPSMAPAQIEALKTFGFLCRLIFTLFKNFVG